MLTNYKTISLSVDKLRKVEKMKAKAPPVAQGGASGGPRESVSQKAKEEKEKEGKKPKLKTKKKVQSGLERYHNMLLKDLDSAVLLFKKWISNKDNHIIATVTKSLNNQQIDLITPHTNADERIAWTDMMVYEATALDEIKADRDISNDIVKEFISEKIDLSPETFNTINNLSSEACGRFMQENPDLAVILFRTLPEKALSESIKFVDPDYVLKIFSSSITITNNMIMEMISKFEAKIIDYKEDAIKFPGLSKAITLLKNSNPQTESQIFKAIAATTSKGIIEEIALEHFPAELIVRLPEDKLKVILSNYSNNKIVQLFAGMNEQDVATFTNAYAPKGTPASDMLRIESARLRKNPVDYQKAVDEHQELWEEFVHYTRDVLDDNPMWVAKVHAVLNVWVDELTGEESLAAA